MLESLAVAESDNKDGRSLLIVFSGGSSVNLADRVFQVCDRLNAAFRPPATRDFCAHGGKPWSFRRRI